MPIPVWLPFALKGGSMVASGIGNYLEGKNQESYSKRVMRMQQEASAKREESERKAGMANVFFGLGGRQQMQPIYQKMPDIDPYESSGKASLFKGLGTGLSYASTALGAYDSASKLLAEQARIAGAREGASRYIDAVANSEAAIGYGPAAALGEGLASAPGGYIDLQQGVGSVLQAPSAVGQAIDNSAAHSTQVLSRLLDQNAEINVPDYKGILGLGDAQEKAYLEGYKTSLGATVEREQGKLLQANIRAMDRADQQASDALQARFAQQRIDLQRETLDLTRLRYEKTDKATKAAVYAQAGKVRNGISTTMQGALLDTPYSGQLIDSKGMLAALKEIKGVDLVMVDGQQRFKISDTASIDGTRLYTFMQKYFRLGSPEAIHEADMTRFQSMGDGFVGDIKVLWHNIRQGKISLLGKSDEEALEMSVSEVFKDRQYFTNNTIENMMNTVLVNQQHVQNEFLGEITNQVKFHASMFKFGPGDYNTLGFVDEAHFTNYYKDQMLGRFGLTDISKALINAPPASNGTGNAVELLNSARRLGVDPDDNTVLNITRGSVTPLELEYNARIMKGKSELTKRLSRGKRSLTESQIAAFQQRFPGMPTSIDDPFWDVEDLSQPAVKALKKGRIGHGYQHYTEEQTALDFLIHNNAADARASWMENADIVNSFSEYQDRDHQNALNSVDAYQNALMMSNYKWGNNLTSPMLTHQQRSPQSGLRDPNTISDAFAPSTRVQSAQEGQAAMLSGFFGLGGLYTDTRNITRAGYPSLAEKYTLNRPHLGSATLDAAKQFHRGGQPIHRYSRPITPSAFRGR
jgi:hypothetical protein